MKTIPLFCIGTWPYIFLRLEASGLSTSSFVHTGLGWFFLFWVDWHLHSVQLKFLPVYATGNNRLLRNGSVIIIPDSGPFSEILNESPWVSKQLPMVINCINIEPLLSWCLISTYNKLTPTFSQRCYYQLQSLVCLASHSMFKLPQFPCFPIKLYLVVNPNSLAHCYIFCSFRKQFGLNVK